MRNKTGGLAVVLTIAVCGAAGCSSDNDDHRGRPARAADNFRDRDHDGVRDGMEDRDRDGIRDGNENGGRNYHRDPDLYR